jgi:hypothetical protein
MHRLLCLAKKINVLHCSVGKRQKNALAGGNTAEGLCAVGFVCWLKPKPCLWVEWVRLLLLMMFIDDAGLCTYPNG